MTQTSRFKLGIDIGGTFTDLTLLEDNGARVHTHKLSSTPDAPSRAVARGVVELMTRIGRTPADIDGFVHGTTIALNAILERRGASVAMMVTEGNRDILEIAREAGYEACFTVNGKKTGWEEKDLEIGRYVVHGTTLANFDPALDFGGGAVTTGDNGKQAAQRHATRL